MRSACTTSRRRRCESKPSRIWHLTGTDWPIAGLKQDYALKMAPNRETSGDLDPYPGRMAETSVRGQGLLRFAFRVEGHVMCWCQLGWRGWSLAAPKRP